MAWMGTMGPWGPMLSNCCDGELMGRRVGATGGDAGLLARKSGDGGGVSGWARGGRGAAVGCKR